jgi:penicillin-binding protein 1A
VQQTRPRWTSRPFVAPANIHWVKIDRVSGKKVFAGSPTEDPKSGIIWEAFKADSEAQRTTRQDELAKQRDALIAAIKRGARAASEPGEAAAPDASPTIAADTAGLGR